jgi:hypothetical protein
MSASEAHPEELLASLVDGTLSPAERAEVEAHLAACSTCREELALARRAASALALLEEADVPVGLTSAIVRGARGGPGRFARTYWAIGATAAAAAVVVLAWVAFHGGGPGGGSLAAQGGGSEASDAATVPVAVSTVNYDAAKILKLAGRLASGTTPEFDRLSPQSGSASAAATKAGTAPAPSAPVPSSSTRSVVSSSTSDPLPCLRKATGPLRGDHLIEVIQARFEGKPAYIAAYRHAPGAGEPPNLLTIWVAARQPACTLLHYASQPLG